MAKFIKIFHCFNFESEDSEIFQLKDDDMKTVVYNKATLRKLYKHGWELKHVQTKMRKHTTSFVFFLEKISDSEDKL